MVVVIVGVSWFGICLNFYCLSADFRLVDWFVLICVFWLGFVDFGILGLVGFVDFVVLI